LAGSSTFFCETFKARTVEGAALTLSFVAAAWRLEEWHSKQSIFTAA
jgi:hypothetical protein